MSTSDSSEQVSQKNDQLMLFEGIIIGIYGNWLVSLIQLLTFPPAIVIAQVSLTLISLFSLVILLAIGVFGGRWENHYIVLVLTIFHYFPLCISLALERFQVQDAFFLLMGGVLFFMVYIAEYIRAKDVERARHKT
jgi:hypothetical protein